MATASGTTTHAASATADMRFARVLALLLAGIPHVLGAAGESWLRSLGGPQTAAH